MDALTLVLKIQEGNGQQGTSAAPQQKKKKSFNTSTSEMVCWKSKKQASNSGSTFPLQISSAEICLVKVKSPVEPRIQDTVEK